MNSTCRNLDPPHEKAKNVYKHALKSMHDSRNSLDHVTYCSRWLGNLIIMLKIYKNEEKHA
jgi:hypothetical protein